MFSWHWKQTKFTISLIFGFYSFPILFRTKIVFFILPLNATRKVLSLWYGCWQLIEFKLAFIHMRFYERMIERFSHFRIMSNGLNVFKVPNGYITRVWAQPIHFADKNWYKFWVEKKGKFKCLHAVSFSHEQCFFYNDD